LKLPPVLASFIKYPKFLYIVDTKLLSASFKQDPAFGFFLRELKKRFNKNALEMPNLESLVVAATTTEEADVYLSFLEKVPELDFIEEQAKEYIRNWVWEAATQIILPNIDSDEGSKYIETLKSSMDAPISTTTMLDIKQDFNEISDIYKQLIPVKEFALGVPPLDNLLRGGISRGELGVLQAVTNVGKTFYVLNSCLVNAKRGYNTAFVSLEMGESEILTRVAMLLLNKSSEDIEIKRESTIRELSEYIKNYLRGNFVLIKDSPGGMGVYEIEQKIKQVQLEYNYKLDYVVIDYDDLIKLSGASEKQYMDIGQLYRDLKSLAQRYNIGILVASQLNRDAMANSKASGLKHTSGSIIKVQVSDLVIHLEDNEAEGLVFRIVKLRRGVKNKTVTVIPDFEHGDLIGIPLQNIHTHLPPSLEGIKVNGFD